MDKFEEKYKNVNKLIVGLYILGCIFLGILVAGEMARFYGKYNERQMEAIAGLLAEKVNISIEHIVDNAEQATLIMANYDLSAYGIYKEMQEYVQSTSFISMGVVDKKGAFYGKSGEWRDMQKYQYIEKCWESREAYITEPYRSCVTANHLITILMPVWTENTAEYIIYASFPLERIQEFARTEALEYQPEIALLNAASGNYIICTDGEMGSAGSWNNLMLMQSGMEFETPSLREDYMQSFRERRASGLVRFALNHREYIQGYVQIESMPDWYIAVNIPVSSLSDILVQYQARTAGYVAVLLAMTAALIVWIIGRQFAQKKRLQKLSQIDSLTGIMNKRTFICEFENYVQKCQKKARGILIFVDIDDFKMYNDTYGHLAGDVVLKTFADTLKELFGDNGYVCRYGGDEFVVFLKGSRTKTEVETNMTLARERFRRTELPEIGIVDVSFSSGLACFPKDGSTYEELCSSADKALYCVKENGKDAFAWHN